MPRTKSSSIDRFDVCCVRGLPNKPMVFPFCGGACAPRFRPVFRYLFPTLLAKSAAGMERDRSPNACKLRSDCQSLNLRLSTPVSSANITPFTAMHCGLSHACDVLCGLPRVAPRQSASNRKPLQNRAPPCVACGGAHLPARRFKTKTSALPPPRMQPIRPLLYSEQPASRLGKSGGERLWTAHLARRAANARNDSCGSIHPVSTRRSFTSEVSSRLNPPRPADPENGC